jgi:hypothetical protein
MLTRQVSHNRHLDRTARDGLSDTYQVGQAHQIATDAVNPQHESGTYGWLIHPSFL